jgi:heptose-I-phosphate ethanolaminephosphotransferase
LVIGESYNKHHSSLYGYALQTTPLQQQRSYNGELFVFQDVVTPWNLTSNVLFDIFSLWEYGMEGEISTQPLFPTLFREAGYSVTFFSNQYALRGMRKGVTTQVGRFFLSDKDISDSMFDFRNSKPSKYDSGLVNQLEDFRKDNGKADYTLDIIHLIGQHFKYEERYPDTIARFSLEDYDNRDLDTEKKEVVMHYDNATYYNDMVLDSIIRLHAQMESVVVFLSDHGEEVYDSLQVSGRLFQKPTTIQARNEFEVPMWIWCSESYQQKHPDVVENIQMALNKPFMTDGLPQILLSLAGISCQWYNENYNLISPTYQPKKRIISGNVDYDKLMATQLK